MATYSNPRLNATIDNWPIGRQRTTAIFAIETDPKRGQRGTRTTIDPKTGKPNKTKVLTYARQARIVDGDDGKTYIAELSAYGHISIMQSNMQFQAEVIHSTDAGYPAALALFRDSASSLTPLRALQPAQ